MYKIKIETKEEIGYYCGIFSVDGNKLCGYENEINHKNVKTYKRKINAEKVLQTLNEMYGNTYSFEIVET